MAAIDHLRSNGLAVKLDENRLLVSPASRITPECRQWLKEKKPQLIEELSANDVDMEVRTLLPEDPPQRQPPWIQWRDQWAEAFDDFTNHHAECCDCIPEHDRYCQEGWRLKRQYEYAVTRALSV